MCTMASTSGRPFARVDFLRRAFRGRDRNQPRHPLRPLPASATMSFPEEDAPSNDRQRMPMSLTRIVVFLSVMSTITAGVHWFVWARLVRDTALPSPWRAVATTAIVTLALLLPAGMWI